MTTIQHVFEADADSLIDSLREIQDESQNADDDVKDFGKDTDKSFSSASMSASGLAKQFGAVGMAVAAVAAGITVAVKATLDFADATNIVAKQAKQLGTTAEELQKVQGAFNLLTDGTVQATDAIKFLQRSTDEATKGTKLQADAFRDLGINVEEFAKLPVGEQLQSIGDHFHNLEGQGQKTNVTMALMGRSAAALIPAFNDGGDAVAEAMAQIERAGVISNETAAASEELADSVELLGQSYKALKGEGLAPLIPVVKTVTDILAGAATGVRDIKTLMFEGIPVADEYGDAILDGATATDELVISTNELAQSFRSVFSIMESDALLESIRNADNASDAYGTLMGSIEAVGNTTDSDSDKILANSQVRKDALDEALALTLAHVDNFGNAQAKISDSEREVLENRLELAKFYIDETAKAEIQGLKESGARKKGGGSGGVDEEAESLKELARVNDMVLRQLGQFQDVQDDVAFSFMDADQQIIASAEARVLGLQEQLAGLLASEEETSEQRLALEQGLADATVAIEGEKNAQLKALSDERFEHQKEDMERLRDEADASIQQVLDNTLEAADAYSNALESLVGNTFGAMKTFGDIAMDQVTSAGDDMTKMQKEQALEIFNINKGLALAESAINTALAVSNAIANAKTLPEAIIAGIAMGVAGGAAQVAIAAEQPPKFHVGGMAGVGETDVRVTKGEKITSAQGVDTASEGDDLLNAGTNPNSPIVVVQQVNNRTTFAAEYKAKRTKKSPYYRMISASQPTKLGLRTV